MNQSTVVTHMTQDGTTGRWCTRCAAHVDTNGDLDQDFYTARQYFQLMAIPIEQRCKHLRAASPIEDEDKTTDIMFQTFFKCVQRQVYKTAVDHGWYEEGSFNDGEKIALIHSELSEALDALRHSNPPDDHIPQFTGVEAELADTVIRIMDYCQHRGFNVAGAIVAKATFNQTRKFKHGGKKF